MTDDDLAGEIEAQRSLMVATAESRIRLRHSGRDPRLLAVAWAALTGCTTTTSLEAAANSTFEQAVEHLAAHPGAYAHLTTSVPPLQPIINQTGPYRIVGHEPGWLTLWDHASAVRVPLTQVQSVSTYDHGRGAIDGALTAGGVGLLLGFGQGSSWGARHPARRMLPARDRRRSSGDSCRRSRRGALRSDWRSDGGCPRARDALRDRGSLTGCGGDLALAATPS
jgi:hypothetical protein